MKKKQNQEEETNQIQEIRLQQEEKGEDQPNESDQNQEQETQTPESQSGEESSRVQGQDNNEDKEPVVDDLELPELDIDGSNTPSFCLLDIQGSTCTLYIYIYIDGEVKVDKVVYQKED